MFNLTGFILVVKTDNNRMGDAQLNNIWEQTSTSR